MIEIFSTIYYPKNSMIEILSTIYFQRTMWLRIYQQWICFLQPKPFSPSLVDPLLPQKRFNLRYLRKEKNSHLR